MLTYLFSTYLLFASATAHCTRNLLSSGVNAYFAAQQGGRFRSLYPLFDNSTGINYFQNGIQTYPIIDTPLTITFNRTIYDTSACATFTELIANSSSTTYVIGTQLRFDKHAKYINLIDMVVAKEGEWLFDGYKKIKPWDWMFNVTGYVEHTTSENWSSIPASERNSRAVLQAAADAYLDAFNAPNNNMSVPWGTQCVKLEGGRYSDNGTCSDDIPSGVPLTRRRYVVDEELGAVEVLVDFAFGPNGHDLWPDSAQFRVEGGKLRYVHSITYCGVQNCGVMVGR